MRSALVLLLLSLPSIAAADVITGGPPAMPSCAVGAVPSRGMRGHGFYCAAGPVCTSDADCSGGGFCQDTALCVMPGSDSAPYACGGDGSCPMGECSRARRCVPPPVGTIPAPVVAPPPPPPTETETEAPPATSSCRASAGGSPRATLALAILVLASLALRRDTR